MERRTTTMMKAMSPVEGKNGKTFWIRVGNAFLNRDGSINVYLNAYPTSGKLQIRPLDESDFNNSRVRHVSETAETMPHMLMEQDELPF